MIQDDPTLSDTPTLLSRLVHEAKALASSEVALAKREISHKVSRAGFGIGLIVGAALVGFIAVQGFAAAAVFGLIALGIPAGWSVLIVAGALALISLILGLTGRARLQADAIKPNQTIQNLKADISTVKEATRA